MNARIRAALRPLMALSLALGAGSLSAADLTLVRTALDEYVALAPTPAGFHRLPLPMNHVSRVQVGGALAWIEGSGMQVLVGAADSGVVALRTDDVIGLSQTLALGDRIAMVEGRTGWVVFGLAERAIQSRTLADRVRSYRIGGSVAWIETTRGSSILAATATGLISYDLGPFPPQRVEVGRDAILTRWPDGRTMLHAPRAREIETVDLSASGRPRQVWLGASIVLTDEEAGEAPEATPARSVFAVDQDLGFSQPRDFDPEIP